MKLDSIYLNKYPPCLQVRYIKTDGTIEYDDNFLKSSDLEQLQVRNKILKSLNFKSLQETVDTIFEKQNSKQLTLEHSKKLHQMQVTYVYASKKKTIISMGQDDTITFQWNNGKTKTIDKVLKPFCGAFYNDIFVAGLLSGRVRAFDTEGDDIFNQQTRNNSPCLALDLCESKIVFGLADGHSYLADLKTGACVQKLSTHKGEVSSIARFNNNVYFTGSFDGTVMINDTRVPEGGLVRSFSAASGISASGLNTTLKEPVIRMQNPILGLSANEYYGELVVHGLRDIKLYDYRMMSNSVQSVSENENIISVAAGWDGKVCYGLESGKIKFFNTSNKYEQLFQFPGQQISFLNPGKCQHVLVAENQRLHCIDLGNGGEDQVLELPSFITGISATYNGDSCVVGMRDGTVNTYRFK